MDSEHPALSSSVTGTLASLESRFAISFLFDGIFDDPAEKCYFQCWFSFHAGFYLFKGIDRPFGGGVESILIRSVFVNWRLGKIFFLILNGLHHKISKKLLYAA
jgi:hypothetical protein